MKKAFIIFLVITILAVIFVLFLIYDQHRVPIRIVEGIEDMSVDKIIERYGEPDYKVSFFIADSTMVLHRPNFYQYYPEEYCKNNNVEIQEYGWERNEKTFVVWFHKKNNEWVVLTNKEWSDDVQF